MLRKLEEDYDPSSRMGAVTKLAETASRGEVLTGVFFLDNRTSSSASIFSNARKRRRSQMSAALSLPWCRANTLHPPHGGKG
jgi:hypothetical protein